MQKLKPTLQEKEIAKWKEGKNLALILLLIPVSHHGLELQLHQMFVLFLYRNHEHYPVFQFMHNQICIHPAHKGLWILLGWVNFKVFKTLQTNTRSRTELSNERKVGQRKALEKWGKRGSGINYLERNVIGYNTKQENFVLQHFLVGYTDSKTLYLVTYFNLSLF